VESPGQAFHMCWVVCGKVLVEGTCADGTSTRTRPCLHPPLETNLQSLQFLGSFALEGQPVGGKSRAGFLYVSGDMWKGADYQCPDLYTWYKRLVHSNTMWPLGLIRRHSKGLTISS
jgi:hypothetical protein